MRVSSELTSAFATLDPVDLRSPEQLAARYEEIVSRQEERRRAAILAAGTDGLLGYAMTRIARVIWGPEDGDLFLKAYDVMRRSVLTTRELPADTPFAAGEAAMALLNLEQARLDNLKRDRVLYGEYGNDEIRARNTPYVGGFAVVVVNEVIRQME